ncbi:MAG: class I SAM-dependent methyltransferase [Rhodospirillaceae bacterium]|nr:MAG: class I SAM-dependent methyltransferase [Rhodospirillaceae bacterium]
MQPPKADTSTLFQDKADLYAAARPLYPVELFEYLASLTAKRHKAWDCATGNGQAAVGLAKHFQRVEATDISNNQISNAFAHERVRYSIQPGEKTEFQDGEFDLINVAQALHWFELREFWTEVRRVLKPGGTFAAYCYVWTHVSPQIDEAIETHIKIPISNYWAPNNRLCWDGYRTIDFPFNMVETPKFEIVSHWDFDQFMNYMHTWSAVRRCMDKEGTSFFDLAGQKILEFWGKSDAKRVIRTPLHVVVGKI